MPSADPRGAQSSLRAPRSPSESALPAAGGGVRRRQASAASSVSRRGLRSPLRRLLCPPSLPSSHFPSSGVYRPRSVLLQEQRSTPRRRQRQRHSRLRRLPAPGPRRRWLQGDRLAHPGGLGPAPPRRLRAQARLLHSSPRRVSGGALGEGAWLLVPAWGAGAGGTGTPRNSRGARAGRGWRRPGEGRLPPAQEAQRRRTHPVVVARGPAHSLTSSGEQYRACGLRGFGPPASLA